MSRTKREVTYRRLGHVERIGKGMRYVWKDGYAEISLTGQVLFPWVTKREAQGLAKSKGLKAVFVEAA